MSSTYRAIVLKKHNLGQRKARKKKSLGNHVDRNAQFENIAKLKAEFIKNGDPVISIDTKKKELIGNFSRDGKTYTQVQVETSDHDFPSAADGKLIPHGIFDVVRNEGHLNLNLSHDTSEFCCDSLAHWWLNYGRKIYATSSKILILCDGGGSNSSRSNLFKEALVKLAIQIGMDSSNTWNGSWFGETNFGMAVFICGSDTANPLKNITCIGLQGLSEIRQNFKLHSKTKIMRSYQMQKIILALSILLLSANSYAIDHSMHGGGTSGGGSGGGSSCEKARFSKFQPEHLATVAPESEFSFLAFNVQKPEQIEVSVKSQPVAITTEPRGDIFHVVGKLPAGLTNTAARIQIKATAKYEKCSGEDGWLVTISE